MPKNHFFFRLTYGNFIFSSVCGPYPRFPPPPFRPPSLLHPQPLTGVGECALPRGRMHVLASLGLSLFCIAGME